jgi:hypothetical protein
MALITYKTAGADVVVASSDPSGVIAYNATLLGALLPMAEIEKFVGSIVEETMTVSDLRELIEEQEFESKPIHDPNDFEVKSRKSVFTYLKSGWHKEGDFVEITEWTNGEGWDINICTSSEGTKMFSIHFTEFELINQMIKFLENE